MQYIEQFTSCTYTTWMNIDLGDIFLCRISVPVHSTGACDLIWQRLYLRRIIFSANNKWTATFKGQIFSILTMVRENLSTAPTSTSEGLVKDALLLPELEWAVEGISASVGQESPSKVVCSNPLWDCLHPSPFPPNHYFSLQGLNHGTLPVSLLRSQLEKCLCLRK